MSASDFELNELTDYAARQNPKRGFMFVSKLLAKYWPSQPAEMLRMHQYLAQALAQSIVGSSVFIGMAEAAAGLGQGVYEAYLEQTDQSEHLFIHTSRYFLNAVQALDFQEQHSHASQFYLYVPYERNLKNTFLYAQTLVLIDDEITTGTTFVNLITAYKKVNPQVQRVLIVCIVSVINAQRQTQMQQLTGVEVKFINALSAQIDFKRDADYQYTQVPNVNSKLECKRQNLSLKAGRLGIHGKMAWDKTALLTLIQTWQSGAKVLVLGTGEFVHLAFLIAYYLEQHGWDVKVQSTARSPLLKGEAIREKIVLQDNYADNIPNYLYNVRVGQYDRIIICHETPLCASLTQFAQRLNADLLYYADGKISLS
ncbi:MAG: phosphoribosyltransferase family protein [Methylococcaceae bacterium]|nr:phosphoribosyltransferase family protein [Methylococcaceae bacterium]